MFVQKKKKKKAKAKAASYHCIKLLLWLLLLSLLLLLSIRLLEGAREPCFRQELHARKLGQPRFGVLMSHSCSDLPFAPITRPPPLTIRSRLLPCLLRLALSVYVKMCAPNSFLIVCSAAAAVSKAKSRH